MGFSELWNLIFFLLEGRGWERMEEEEEEDCQLYAYGAEHVARRARGAQNTWRAEHVVGGKRLSS